MSRRRLGEPVGPDAQLGGWLMTLPMSPLRELAGHRGADTTLGLSKRKMVDDILRDPGLRADAQHSYDVHHQR